MNACIHSAIAPNMNRCINCGKVWTGDRWEAESVDSVEGREGYEACLHGLRRDRNPYFPQDSKPAVEWFKGWDKAAREIKGRG